MAGIFDMLSGLLMPPGLDMLGGGGGGGGMLPGLPGLPGLGGGGGGQQQQGPSPLSGGGLDMLTNFIPGMGGGASAGAGAGGASGAGGAGAAGGMGLGAMFAIPAAAIAGASALSADSAAAGKGAGIENWLGPLYNIPEAISRGDWDDVMKDGAMGPVGAIYNIASGKDPWKSFANSLGPLGQVPWLIGSGQMPFSGGKTSKNFMSAFQGRGI